MSHFTVSRIPTSRKSISLKKPFSSQPGQPINTYFLDRAMIMHSKYHFQIFEWALEPLKNLAYASWNEWLPSSVQHISCPDDVKLLCKMLKLVKNFLANPLVSFIFLYVQPFRRGGVAKGAPEFCPQSQKACHTLVTPCSTIYAMELAWIINFSNQGMVEVIV